MTQVWSEEVRISRWSSSRTTGGTSWSTSGNLKFSEFKTQKSFHAYLSLTLMQEGEVPQAVNLGSFLEFGQFFCKLGLDTIDCRSSLCYLSKVLRGNCHFHNFFQAFCELGWGD